MRYAGEDVGGGKQDAGNQGQWREELDGEEQGQWRGARSKRSQGEHWMEDKRRV